EVSPAVRATPAVGRDVTGRRAGGEVSHDVSMGVSTTGRKDGARELVGRPRRRGDGLPDGGRIDGACRDRPSPRALGIGSRVASRPSGGAGPGPHLSSRGRPRSPPGVATPAGGLRAGWSAPRRTVGLTVTDTTSGSASRWLPWPMPTQ